MNQFQQIAILLIFGLVVIWSLVGAWLPIVSILSRNNPISSQLIYSI